MGDPVAYYWMVTFTINLHGIVDDLYHISPYSIITVKIQVIFLYSLHASKVLDFQEDLVCI